jgi:hypothetical protein
MDIWIMKDGRLAKRGFEEKENRPDTAIRAVGIVP